MKPLQVTHVTGYYPPHLGGMEQMVAKLAEMQCESGMEVHVLTSDQGCKGARRPSLEQDWPKVRRLWSAYIMHTPIIPGLMVRLLRIRRNDIVHVHIAHAYTPEAVLLAAKLKGFRYLAHMHLDALPSQRLGYAVLPIYKRLVLRAVLQNAAKVIVPTIGYMDMVHEKYGVPCERIFVIPNATDHAITGSKSLSGDKDPVRILFVGRLVVQKNIPLLLSAMKDYTERYERQIDLSIVGDGDQKDYIDKMIVSLELHDIVTMKGSLFGNDLEREFFESDIFVLCSTHESFGIVLIEAMAKGLPIVAVDILGVSDVVGNGVNGLLTAGDPSSLADAIHGLIDSDQLYCEISANNVANARKYTWESVRSLLSQVYADVS